MGRRRKRDDGDYDDTLEREYLQRRYKKTPGTNEESSRQKTEKDEPLPTTDRPKKKSRKQRKKEKKAARLKQEEEEKLEAEKTKEPNGDRLARDRFSDMRKGVKYLDIIVGNGPHVRDRKKVRVKYTLRSKSKAGKVLDSSDNFGFRLGKGEVIEGWDIGLEGMRQGGLRHLVIPPEAGYGRKDIGAGPGADLYFEITLLSC